VIKKCGEYESGSITAAFGPDENLAWVYPRDPDNPGQVTFGVVNDSTMVSIILVGPNGDKVHQLVVDSLMTGGIHSVALPEGDLLRKALYADLTAGTFTHRYRIHPYR
jgi:hypothetical protein